jgi:hypothetical protein
MPETFTFPRLEGQQPNVRLAERTPPRSETSETTLGWSLDRGRL